MTQTTFDAWTAPAATERAENAQERSYAGLPPCPWCWASSVGFRERRSGLIGCSTCSAVIPVNAAWYLAGERIAPAPRNW